ncbi:MAG TPA: hypothetical protein VGB69_08675 [Edaphobacter sp.]
MNHLKSLKRLSALYGQVEQFHSGEARVAAAQVHEAESAIGAEIKMIHEARVGARMEEGDTMSRSMMAAQVEIATRRRRKLEPLLEKRKEVSAKARTRHVESRLWSERMKSLVDGESARIAEYEARRLQGEMDDRFLSQSSTKDRSEEGKR